MPTPEGIAMILGKIAHSLSPFGINRMESSDRRDLFFTLLFVPIIPWSYSVDILSKEDIRYIILIGAAYLFIRLYSSTIFEQIEKWKKIHK